MSAPWSDVASMFPHQSGILHLVDEGVHVRRSEQESERRLLHRPPDRTFGGAEFTGWLTICLQRPG